MEQHVCWMITYLPAFDPWQDLTSSFWAFCFLVLDQRSPHLTSGLCVISDSQLPTPNWFWLSSTDCSPQGSRGLSHCSHQLLLPLFLLSPAEIYSPNNSEAPPSGLLHWLWLNTNNDYYECPFSEMLTVLLHLSSHLISIMRRISFIPVFWGQELRLRKINHPSSHCQKVSDLGPIIFTLKRFPMLTIY